MLSFVMNRAYESSQVQKTLFCIFFVSVNLCFCVALYVHILASVSRCTQISMLLYKIVIISFFARILLISLNVSFCVSVYA